MSASVVCGVRRLPWLGSAREDRPGCPARRLRCGAAACRRRSKPVLSLCLPLTRRRCQKFTPPVLRYPAVRYPAVRVPRPSRVTRVGAGCSGRVPLPSSSPLPPRKVGCLLSELFVQPSSRLQIALSCSGVLEKLPAPSVAPPDALKPSPCGFASFPRPSPPPPKFFFLFFCFRKRLSWLPSLLLKEQSRTVTYRRLKSELQLCS